VNAPPARAGRWELADIVRAHADDLDGLSPGQRRVLHAIAQCRTATLGGHRRQCAACGHEDISYNSCRNRHCPKCQGLEEARWVEAQQRDLLPVQYFHIVFTVPTELHALFLSAPSVAYRLLFTAAATTLEAVASRRLGAKIGFTAVLHTWTQQLLYHPHIHCIVPGGGLDLEETRWVSARRDFFLPVRVLAQVFRGTLLGLLENALDHGTIRGPDGDARRPLKQAARKKWVVYSKAPFAGAAQVLAYLGRYAYRIALSNDRLVGLRDGQVTFRWKDRAHGNAPGSPRSMPPPSSAGFCSTSCPAASSGSATTDSWPTRYACRHCLGCASGSPRRRSPSNRTPPGSRNDGTRCCSG